MGKTRYCFKKVRNFKGVLHEKIDAIQNRNRIDLTEAEGIMKMWQKWMEELHKKDLNDIDNMMVWLLI